MTGSGGGERAAKPRAALDLIKGQVTDTEAERGLDAYWEDPPQADFALVKKVRDFGDGRCEVVVYETFVGAPRADGPVRSRPEGAAPKETDVERAARRARRTVRHRCMAIGVDRLLTLTYRANVTEAARMRADFDRFRRLMQAAGYLDHFVAVPERQKRGAWHVHVAIRGYLPVKLARACWLRIVGEGNIDVAKRPAYGRSTNRIAAYIAKYIGKGFEAETAGRARYMGSRGWGPPKVTLTIMSTRDWVDAIRAAYGEADLRGGSCFEWFFSSSRGVFWLSSG